MTKRSGLVCVVWIASLLASAATVRAQCTTPTGDTGFNDVIFTPAAGTFSTVLPFDVPLRICAEVPDGTTRATVKYASGDRRLGPIDVDADTCTIRSPGIQWGPEFARQPTAAANGPTTVRWVVGRLEAERYYVFCFGFEKTATDAEITTFRQATPATLDEGLAAVTSPTLDLTREQTRGICQELRSRLLTITGTNNVLTHGTVFDCTDDQVDAFATKITLGPLQAQRRAQLVIAGRPSDDPNDPFSVPSLGTRQSELQAILAALQANPSVGKLVDALAQQGALDPAVGARAQSLCPTCPSLLGSGATPAARLALGEDATSTPNPPLTVQSPPAQPTAMAQSYLNTAQALSGLAATIQWVLGEEGPPAVVAALSDADQAALADLAKAGGPLSNAAGKANTLASLSQSLATHLRTREDGIQALASELSIVASTLQLADASTLGNFITNQTNYISLDAGLTWAPELEELVPYMGTNIYFRPVNRNAPLRSLGSFRQTFSRRFSMTLGLTLSSISDDTSAGGTQTDLFGNQSLMLGAGLRITDAFRLGAGAIVFKEDDPSPLIDEEKLNYSYYLSFSFDVDVVNLFSKPLATAFGVGTGGGS
ncbi:MAG TPA: hypothetical protein VN811_07260 [Thermoanaerobaculia bacterium]|nr:hypothetical protein [Thermoanaerobaculia bacterium]